MVGVPGKSKGCSTCRRRKKGCDQRRPVCGQCASSGYVCGGYQRDLTFIVHPASKSAQKAYFVPRSALENSLALMPTLDRTAIDLQCRSLFLDIFLPHGTAEAPAGMLRFCQQPPNWTAIITDLSAEEPALELAFSALSISRVGRANQDMRLVKESSKLYGWALKHLQKALCDKERSHSEEVLAACSLLGLYEIFEGGWSFHKSVGWVSHAQGAARLIELRGPSKHVSLHAHHIFTGARVPILFSAIVRRKRSFLEKAEWLTIPWGDGDNANMKTYFEKLVDLITQVPGLLQDFDDARGEAASSNAPQALLDVLSAIHELHDGLKAWDAGKRPHTRPFTIKHERTKDDAYPFDEELTWDNHLFFHSSVLYWSASYLLATTSSQIKFLLASLGFPLTGFHANAATSQNRARECATMLVKSVPYAMMPDMGALGVYQITFPICLAFQYFLEANDEQVCAWMSTIGSSMRRQGMNVPAFQKAETQASELRSDSIPKIDRKLSNDSAVDNTVSLGFGCSDSDNDGAASPSSANSHTSFKPTFIYENPAKYYIDISICRRVN